MSTALLILGSGSATRKLILSEMGLPFEVYKPSIDEKAIRFPNPTDLVLALGKAKAEALLNGPFASDFASRSALLLTADQVVAWGDQILEKPETAEEARRFIRGYGKLAPRTVGSCVVTDSVTREQWVAVDEATIIFDPIPEDTIEQLIAAGEVYHCAGGLMVEHPLVQPHVRRIDGTIDSVRAAMQVFECEPTNSPSHPRASQVMGLKKTTLARLLDEAAAARAAQREA